MAKRFWAGVDVGVETTSVCIIDDDGSAIHEGCCPSDVVSVHRELRQLRRRRHARVLEAATGMHLARGLRNLGYQIDLYETRKLSKFLRLRRNKTDAGDAHGIAEAGRLGARTISKVHLKSFEAQCLQATLTIRRQLIRQRIATGSLRGRQLDLFGGRLQRSSLVRTKVDAEIKKIFSNRAETVASQLRTLVDQRERLLDYQRTIDRELEHAAREIEICRRFMEIPGVGPICALTFYACVSDPHRFGRSADIGSYLGLAPTISQSGLTSRAGRISKMGNRAARMLLVNASMGFIRRSDPNADLRSWAATVEHRAGHRKATIALARKLAIVMIAMWKSGASYQPNFACSVERAHLTGLG